MKALSVLLASLVLIAGSAHAAEQLKVEKGCSGACAQNVQNVMLDGPTRYTLKVDSAEKANFNVTWRSKSNSALKPVKFEGQVPVKLRHTSMHSYQLIDSCNVSVTLIEESSDGDSFKAYQVSARNVACKPSAPT